MKETHAAAGLHIDTHPILMQPVIKWDMFRGKGVTKCWGAASAGSICSQSRVQYKLSKNNNSRGVMIN